MPARNLTTSETFYLRNLMTDLLEESADHGFYRLVTVKNGGLYAESVSVPGSLDDLIVKVVRNRHIDGYSLFANWVFKNRMWEKSKHFPRIYAIETFNSRAAYLMERLSHFELFTSNGKTPEYNMQDKAFSMLNWNNQIDEEMWNANSFFSACKTMKDELEKDGFGGFYDLHNKNVMIRASDNALVITDPVTS